MEVGIWFSQVEMSKVENLVYAMEKEILQEAIHPILRKDRSISPGDFTFPPLDHINTKPSYAQTANQDVYRR